MTTNSSPNCTNPLTPTRAISRSSSTGTARRYRCRTCCRCCSRWASRSPTSDLTRSNVATATSRWIYDFGLRHRAGRRRGRAGARLHERFHDALAAAWQGHAEVDGFQALVLEAGLTWRQVAVFRAYAKYLRQAGYRFSQEYLESALRANTDVVRLLSVAVRNPPRPCVCRRPRLRRAGDRRADPSGRSTRSPVSTKTASCAVSWG